MTNDLMQEMNLQRETDTFMSLSIEEKQAISWKADTQRKTLPEDCKLENRSVIDMYAHRLSMLLNGELAISAGKDHQEYTLKKLAEIAECSIEGFRKIVKGKNKSVNITYLNRIASALGCSAYYLLGLSDDPLATCIDSKIWHSALTFVTDEEEQRRISLDAYEVANWARDNPKLYEAFRLASELNNEQKRLLCDLVRVLAKSNTIQNNNS